MNGTELIDLIKDGLYWDASTGLYREPIGFDSLGPLFEDIGCIGCGGTDCDGFCQLRVGGA